MAYSLLVLTRYGRAGPSSRIRHYNYLPALQRAGFEVTVAPFFDDGYTDRLYRGEKTSGSRLLRACAARIRRLLRAGRYDLLWIEKEALPWLPAIAERALLARRNYVVDFDDAWHLRYQQHPHGAIRLLMRSKLEDVASRARLVIVGNAFLSEWATHAGARPVLEIPSTVDLSRYSALPVPDGPFTIGWIGTPATAEYLHLIAEPLRRVQSSCGAKVFAIGAGNGFSLPGVDLERIAWREADEGRSLARCHVGVAPLRDEMWERGKCGYKLLQYMAAGRATVASPVGANASIVSQGETGFLARDIKEWAEALHTLAADRNLCRRLGANGRRRVESMYSLDAIRDRLVAALVEAAECGRRGNA